MKKISISENTDIKVVFEKTKQLFPDLNIIKKGAKYIFIKDKAVMTVIRKKENVIKLYSDLNMKHKKVYIPMIIGIILGIIGVIFAIAILYIYYTKKRKKLHKEVYMKLNEELIIDK